MKRKNVWNISTLYIVMIGVMIAQTIISFFFSKAIFAVMLVFTVAVSTIAIYRMLNMQSYIRRTFRTMGESMEASSNMFTKFSVPVMIVSDKGEIVWYNDALRRNMLDGDDLFGQDIGTVVDEKARRALVEKKQAQVTYGDRIFSVFRSSTNYEGTTQLVYFFVDETKLLRTAEEYAASRPVVAIIALDNLDEITKNAKESEKAAVSGTIETVLENWASGSHGILRKLSSQRFMLIMEERSLETTIETRFDVLDQVRSLDFGGRGKATLSVGVGHNCANFAECETAAYLALEMAQGRGGDQAAVKDVGNNYRFFGGISKAVEKHTRVRARIVASAIKELIDGSDTIVIMGHRYADLDAFGASVAFWSLAKQLGKDAFVVMDRKTTMAAGLLSAAESYYGEPVACDGHEVVPRMDKKTLLIVLDTHRPDFLDCREVYDAASTVVVIDHHRRAVDCIGNAVIFYHETAASSASEMTAELIQAIGEQYVGRMEAEALLSGIMLDTKNFVLHTGVRTFESSAFLRRRGADPVVVKKLFSGSMEGYRQKSEIIAAAQMYKDCAIAVCREETGYTRLAASQAADEMLNIDGVHASFTLFRNGEEIDISARSYGDINVQLIMEALGGGGHQTMAAAQLKADGFEAAVNALVEAIDTYKLGKNPG
ncbi:MAG: DHH family phosphoesterase [Candidatus Howiella sp.]